MARPQDQVQAVQLLQAPPSLPIDGRQRATLVQDLHCATGHSKLAAMLRNDRGLSGRQTIFATWILGMSASCGFPRPPDVGPSDGSGGGTAADCHADQECQDPAQPICISGHCLSPAEACQEAGGARIVFLTDRGGALEVYGAYADGSDPIRLASGIVPDGNAAPSPDGAAIAFVQQSSMTDVNVISTVDTYGKKVTQIIQALDHGSYVEWSPDGSTLVVGDRNSQQMTPTMVYTVKRNARVQQLAGYVDGGALNSDPAWSPDSSQIAFVSISPTQFTEVGIWILASDGSHGAPTDEQGYFFGAPRYFNLRWAPNGNTIAYLTNENGNLDIVLKTLNGAAGRVLATPSMNESDIVWSHDGSKIAFVRASGANRNIWVMNADGSAQASVAEGEHPRWSTDDRFLLFDTKRDGNREIYRMRSDGANPINLTNDPGDDAQAEWATCPN